MPVNSCRAPESANNDDVDGITAGLPCAPVPCFLLGGLMLSDSRIGPGSPREQQDQDCLPTPSGLKVIPYKPPNHSSPTPTPGGRGVLALAQGVRPIWGLWPEPLPWAACRITPGLPLFPGWRPSPCWSWMRKRVPSGAWWPLWRPLCRLITTARR